MISHRIANILDRLSQWGPSLIGRQVIFIPEVQANPINDNKLVVKKFVDDRLELNDFYRRITKSMVAGYRGKFIFAYNYDHLIGCELFINGQSKGILTSMKDGIYQTSSGESFDALKYIMELGRGGIGYTEGVSLYLRDRPPI